MKHVLIEGDPSHWTPDKMQARMEKDGADTVTVFWCDADGTLGCAVIARGLPNRVLVRRRKLSLNGNGAGIV